MMGLQEIKNKIEIRSADPEENARLKGWIMEPNDCFGRGFDGGGTYCKECTVMAKLDDRFEPLNIFCQELSPHENPEAVGGDIVEEEEKPVEKPEKKPQKQPKKKEVKNMEETVQPKETQAGLLRKLIADGKTDEEIIQVLLPAYIEKGKTGTFSSPEAYGKNRIRWQIKIQRAKAAPKAE